MYLLGAATSYIILPSAKISVGCGPDEIKLVWYCSRKKTVSEHEYTSLREDAEVQGIGEELNLISVVQLKRNVS